MNWPVLVVGLGRSKTTYPFEGFNNKGRVCEDIDCCLRRMAVSTWEPLDKCKMKSRSGFGGPLATFFKKSQQ